MADMLMKAGQGLLDWQSRQLQPVDPYYEPYTSSKGEVKWRRRPMPPGLTSSEKSRLRKVRKRAHFLDEGYSKGGSHLYPTALTVKWHRLCVNVGILVHGRDSIIEVTGDVPDILLCYSLVLRPALSAGIPQTLRHRMLLNYALASGAPNVPFIGSAIASAVKPNSRNAILFEDYLIRQVLARTNKLPPAPKTSKTTVEQPLVEKNLSVGKQRPVEKPKPVEKQQPFEKPPPTEKIDPSQAAAERKAKRVERKKERAERKEKRREARKRPRATSTSVLMVKGVDDGKDVDAEEATQGEIVSTTLETATATHTPAATAPQTPPL